MLGQIRDELDVSVEEYEEMLRAEAKWVMDQTTQTIGIFVTLAVCVSTILLVIVFWGYGDLPFLLALVRSIIIAFFGCGIVGGAVAFYLSGRYGKQTKSRLEKYKARKAAEVARGSGQPSLTEAVQGLVDAASKAVGDNPEQLEALLSTWADAGMKELQPYADKLKKDSEFHPAARRDTDATYRQFIQQKQ
jgi:gas vesicle protein